MMEMKSATELQVSSGDFNAKIEDKCLLVPDAVFAFNKSLGGRNVEEFINIMQIYPSAFMIEFGWDKTECDLAKSKLITMLEGHVDPKLLYFKANQMSFGAMKP